MDALTLAQQMQDLARQSGLPRERVHNALNIVRDLVNDEEDAEKPKSAPSAPA